MNNNNNNDIMMFVSIVICYFQIHQGDCHHWTPILKRFEAFFDAYVKHGTGYLLESSSPAPTDNVPVSIEDAALTTKIIKGVRVLFLKNEFNHA